MKLFVSIVAVCFLSCNTTRQLANSATELPKNTSLNGKLFSSLFHQRAAEYRALCLQGYNIARMRIDSYKPITNKPLAIITDIDETILDNSPYAVHQAYNGKEYDTQSWYEWTEKAAADTMPGAGAFLSYAASKNVRIFYITNRDEKEKAATIRNLQRFNLPDADEAHFFGKQNISSKELRRQQVMQGHEVILLMGDNLADLSSLYDKKTEEERRSNTDILAAEFGKKFIIFPNVNYGDWESSMYKYNYKLTQMQKDSVIRNALKNYN